MRAESPLPRLLSFRSFVCIGKISIDRSIDPSFSEIAYLANPSFSASFCMPMFSTFVNVYAVLIPLALACFNPCWTRWVPMPCLLKSGCTATPTVQDFGSWREGSSLLNMCIIANPVIVSSLTHSKKIFFPSFILLRRSWKSLWGSFFQTPGVLPIASPNARKACRSLSPAGLIEAPLTSASHR